MHLADLARAQAKLRVRALARQHLHVRAGRARELRALARLHLDAMHFRADRDVAQRERVARLDGRLGSRHEFRADRHALRREHIAALAILVQEKRDMRAAVRVMLEALDLGRNRVLVAPPVDDAQVMLVAATLVAHGDAAMVIAPAAALLRLGELREGTALIELWVDDLDERAAAR